VKVNGASVDNARHSDNAYRPGGFLIKKNTFKAMLNRKENLVEIFM